MDEKKAFCAVPTCWQTSPCATHDVPSGGAAPSKRKEPAEAAPTSSHPNDEFVLAESLDSHPPFLDMPRFTLKDKADWLPFFKKNGVVVLRDVLNPSEVEHAKSLYWEWLEGLGSGIKRGDASTWEDDNWPGVTRLGFMPSHGGGHNKASWYCRTRPAIQEAFASLWNVKPTELLSSFDTWILWRPWWLEEDEDWRPHVENLHIDQNPHFKRGFQCVQGMLPLLPVVPEVGGLQVVPCTNTDEVQTAMVARYTRVKRNDSDWLELPEDDPYIGKGRLLRANPGDFILWDSRTIHAGFVGCGRPRGAPQGEGKDELVRMSMTICMTPASKATSGVIEARWGAFEKGKCLTHWPHEFHPHHMGDTAGRNIPRRPFKVEVELTEEIRRLIGKRDKQ